MVIKSYFFVMCIFLLEGCTQPKMGWKSIDCNDLSKNVVAYSLESLNRDYECKKAQQEDK